MRLSKSIYLTAVYLFFYIPIAVVVLLSFNNAARSLIWHGFTTKWYQQLLHDNDLLTVVLHSLTLGILAASIATIIGTLTAVTLFRYRFYSKKIIHGLIFILIILPDIVIGIALLILYNAFRIPLGFWSLLLAHITFCIPFVAVTVHSRIITLNNNIFEAAHDLGATDFTIYKKIIIPLLFPAIVAGWLLSFTLSLDNVIISYFVSGPGYEILPLKIYSMVRLGVKPEINALCTIMLAITIILVIIARPNIKKL